MKTTKFIFMILAVIFISGCVSKLDYTDVSKQKGYSKWIGKLFRTKREIFVVLDTQYNKEFLMEVGTQFLPSIEEYKNTGKSRKDIFSNFKITGIIKKNSEFEIVSIGFYVFCIMMGPEEIVAVKDKSNRNIYYIRTPGVFYFDNNSLYPHEAYIEMLPSSVKETLQPVKK